MVWTCLLRFPDWLNFWSQILHWWFLIPSWTSLTCLLSSNWTNFLSQMRHLSFFGALAIFFGNPLQISWQFQVALNGYIRDNSRWLLAVCFAESSSTGFFLVCWQSWDLFTPKKIDTQILRHRIKDWMIRQLTRSTSLTIL